MFFHIDRKQLEDIVGGKFREATAFASDLGLKAGEWPMFIAVTSPTSPNSSEGWLFRRSEFELDKERDLVSQTYRTTGGMKLTLWND
jgi:hypothetical protein